MREIKFRVWDNELKIIFSPNNQIGGLWSIKESHNGIVKYKDGALMQYTGLKDKNDKEIYEGDIISGKPIIGKGTIEAKVIFSIEKGMWLLEEITDYEPPDIEYLFEITKDKRHEAVIIGNIYENPELIKE